MRRISKPFTVPFAPGAFFARGPLDIRGGAHTMVIEQDFQGGVKFSTGGIAHEPQGMIRCDSEAGQYSLDERKSFTQLKLCI